MWKPLEQSGRGGEEKTVAAGKQVLLIQSLTNHRTLRGVKIQQQ